ncbi:MAG: hypothetical protein HY905_25920 [Deltaproteobacteria bacterium]|nr:hypothetical protein [Deltaproteobacteria bacterium]
MIESGRSFSGGAVPAFGGARIAFGELGTGGVRAVVADAEGDVPAGGCGVGAVGAQLAVGVEERESFGLEDDEEAIALEPRIAGGRARGEAKRLDGRGAVLGGRFGSGAFG